MSEITSCHCGWKVPRSVRTWQTGAEIIAIHVQCPTCLTWLRIDPRSTAMAHDVAPPPGAPPPPKKARRRKAKSVARPRLELLRGGRA